MKRIFSMLCAVAICLGMAGCGANKPVGDDPTAVYLDGEKVISLGMSEDEIEAVLKPNDEEKYINDVYKAAGYEIDKKYSASYGVIDVRYEDEISYSITIKNQKYTDCFGNKPGMKYEKVMNSFDEEYIKTVVSSGYFKIGFDENGKEVVGGDLLEVSSYIEYNNDEKNGKIERIEIKRR